MSTRYDLVCHRCKKAHILGFLRPVFSLAYGSNDTATTDSLCRFITDHILCGCFPCDIPPEGSRTEIMVADAVPDDYEDVTPEATA